MGIGISVVLLVVGLVLLTGAVDLPASVTDHVATNTVGWICVIVAILGFALAVFARPQPAPTRLTGLVPGPNVGRRDTGVTEGSEMRDSPARYTALALVVVPAGFSVGKRPSQRRAMPLRRGRPAAATRPPSSADRDRRSPERMPATSSSPTEPRPDTAYVNENFQSDGPLAVQGLGGDGRIRLFGRSGVIEGGRGDDRLFGGPGPDTLIGASDTITPPEGPARTSARRGSRRAPSCRWREPTDLHPLAFGSCSTPCSPDCSPVCR